MSRADAWGPLAPYDPAALAALPVGVLARIVRRQWDPLYWLERDEPELAEGYARDVARFAGDVEEDPAGVAAEFVDAAIHGVDLYVDRAASPLARLARTIATRERPDQRPPGSPSALDFLKGLPR